VFENVRDFEKEKPNWKEFGMKCLVERRRIELPTSAL